MKLSQLFVMLACACALAPAQQYPAGNTGGAPNLFVAGAGPATSTNINISSLNLTSATLGTLTWGCSSGTGFTGGLVTGPLTSITSAAMTPTTSTASFTFSSTSNYLCVVNSNGGVGPAGPNGTNGTNGANGNTILNGSSGPPSSGTGNNGDFYLYTPTSCLYGPKASGSWPGTCTSLVGPTGSTGANGAGNNTYCQDATGSGTAYTCPTPVPTVSTLSGLIVSFVPQTNSGATPTLNIQSLGAVALRQSDCSTAVTGLNAHQLYLFSYNGSVLCQGSSAGSSSGVGVPPYTLCPLGCTTTSVPSSGSTITAATHNQGVFATGYCWDSAGNEIYPPACSLAQTNPTAPNGNLVLTYTTAPTAIVIDGSGGGLSNPMAAADQFIGSGSSSTGASSAQSFVDCVSNGGVSQYKASTHAWTCHTLVSADIPNNAANTSGLSGTATALASNGSNCSSGNAPLGVDASGNVESCFKTVQQFFGTAAPGSVAGNLPGDRFSDTTNHNDYWCNAPSATAAPACTSVTTGGWTLANGGAGGGGTGNKATLTTVTFSATPTFTCGSSSAGTVDSFELSTSLSANITSSTLSGCTPGETLNFSFTQAASGGPYTVAMPTGFSQACSVSPIPSVITNMVFFWDGTTAQLLSCQTSGAPSISATSSFVTQTPVPGKIFYQADSGVNTQRSKDSSGNFYSMAKELPAGTVRAAGGPDAVDLPATGHGIAVLLVCADSSGSPTAQSCSTSPSFTPAAGDMIIYTTTTQNTGALTIAVNGASAAGAYKWAGSTALASGDIPANKPIKMVFDAAGHWDVDDIGNAPSGGGVSSVNTLTGAVTLFTVNPQTATYQVLAADFAACKTISVASGTFTITLVASGSQPPNGQCVNIVNYGSGTVTIARSGQNINGGVSSLSLTAGSATAPTNATVWSDGTNYFATVGGEASGSSGVVNTYRTCDIPINDTSGVAITSGQMGPQSRVCFIPAAATIVEMDVNADAGTPNIIVGRNRAGTIVNIVSGALATAASGGIACSNTGGTTGLNGATTCSSTLQNTSLSAGDYLELVSGTPGGTAKFFVAHIVYTVN